MTLLWITMLHLKRVFVNYSTIKDILLNILKRIIYIQKQKRCKSLHVNYPLQLVLDSLCHLTVVIYKLK
jgi:hypothetical protein